MIKVGVLGLGKMGLLHLFDAAKIEDVEVVTAADNSKKALAKARNLGVKNLFEDYRELLDSSLGMDAVIISLPNFSAP